MPAFIEKIRVPVRISEASRTPAVGFLSLSPSSQAHDGPETLLDLLNSNLRILPFHRHEDGAMLLVTRMNIAYVTVGSEVDSSLVRPRTFQVTHEERVLVEFEDGVRLEGNIQMELPEHLNRISDFLNLEDDYFPLVSRQGTALVNKSKVRVTRVFAKSPAPIEAI
jgi:hypothetical protein